MKYKTIFAFRDEFRLTASLEYKAEWLVHLGQPMLYDGELYVVRRPHNEMTPTEYYRWMKGVRVC
ncbi:MAG: hypothetical protein BWY21_00063 [Parcubacteria group bacterium ADurb.Bin216]|nr:MAG: hypothetical protein BWY21_00063 [Parcubacteria group bacterium ADurb.Bin216]